MASCPLRLRGNHSASKLCPIGHSYPKDDDFFSSAQFSPDGYCALTSSELGMIALNVVSPNAISQNSYFQTTTEHDSPPLSNTNFLEDCGSFHAGEAIYDMKWYPHMNSADEASCCFATTSRDHPIHLWGTEGSIRCTYRGHNHLDELDAANCIAFNLSGQNFDRLKSFDIGILRNIFTFFPGEKIYAGSNRVIR